MAFGAVAGGKKKEGKRRGAENLEEKNCPAVEGGSVRASTDLWGGKRLIGSAG